MQIEKCLHLCQGEGRRNINIFYIIKRFEKSKCRERDKFYENWACDVCARKLKIMYLNIKLCFLIHTHAKKSWTTNFLQNMAALYMYAHKSSIFIIMKTYAIKISIIKLIRNSNKRVLTQTRIAILKINITPCKWAYVWYNTFFFCFI